MYIPPLPEKISAKAAADILVHCVRFQEFTEPKIYFLHEPLPNPIETEKWMSEKVIMLLPELFPLKQLFTPVELIRETAKKVRSLNDPDLDRNLLRQFVIADGTLRFIDTIQNMTGSGQYSGIGSLAFFVEMVKDNPHEFIRSYYRLDKIRKIQINIESEQFDYIRYLTKLQETPEKRLTYDKTSCVKRNKDLHFDDLSILDPAALQLPRLKKCILIQHQAGSPIIFEQHDQLRDFKMKSCSVPSVIIENCAEIRSIHLSENACFHVHIKDCPKLTHLHIASFGKRINLEIKNCPSLRHVVFYNLQTEDNDFISNASNSLVHLTMINCALDAFPQQLKTCDHLKTLVISRNPKIMNVPEWVNTLKKLKHFTYEKPVYVPKDLIAQIIKKKRENPELQVKKGRSIIEFMEVIKKYLEGRDDEAEGVAQ